MRVGKFTATAKESEEPSKCGILAWLAGDDAALEHLQAQVADDGRGGAPGSEPADGGSDSRAYLESNTACCGNPNETENRQGYEVRACACRSRFCEKCCVHLGLKLRADLIPVLETFKGLQMWTLTIDPGLFNSPQEALEYCRSKRVIGELIRALRNAGVLHSERYFWVMEWQKDTEMPHYHLLVDASYVPFELVCNIWNRNRPKAAGPVEGQRPGFGAVRFSAPKFTSARHAAHYACKYVIKHPEYGFPRWVLDFKGNMLRYSVSKGFWPRTETDNGSCVHLDSDEEGHDPTCFCEACRGEISETVVDMLEPKKANRKTIAERIAECGESTLVLEYEDIELPDGTTKRQRRFVANVPLNFERAAELVTGERPEKSFVEVTKEDADWLRNQFRPPERRPQRWEVFDDWNGVQADDESKAGGWHDPRGRTVHPPGVATVAEPDGQSPSGTAEGGATDHQAGASQILFWSPGDSVFRTWWE